MTVFVTNKQFDAHLNRIMNANLKQHSTSPSLASMKLTGVIDDIQSDRNGMIVRDDWREELNHLNLIPTQSLQERTQDAILKAIERHKKSRGQFMVVRFTSQTNRVRYRVYPDTRSGFKAFDDAFIGERVQSIGFVNKVALNIHPDHPLPFFPESTFRDEYKALPLNVEWELKKFGMPYDDWVKTLTQSSAS